MGTGEGGEAFGALGAVVVGPLYFEFVLVRSPEGFFDEWADSEGGDFIRPVGAVGDF